MKIYKLSAIFLFLLVGVFHSNTAFSAVNCVQFSSELDLKAFPNNSLCHFSKKTTEHKCYAKEVNNRNISCYSNSDNWSCKSGYRKSGEKCIKKASTYITKKIPKNSHKVGSGWTCNTNFYRNNSKTYCLKIPNNSSSSYSSNIFTCNSGYSKKGKGCIKNSATLSIPKNAHEDGDNWTCDKDFYRNNAKTSCLAVPANSYSRFYSNDFFCNAGYKEKGNQCDQIAKPLIIPMNAHEDGDNWTCDTNFYRNNAKTACLGVPANAFSRFYSNIFLCNDGYEKNGTRCVKKAAVLKVPNNAHKVGSNWVCNYNYYSNKPKTGCLKVPPNSTSLNDSNDFKCNSGYKRSGSGCVKKTIPNNSHKAGSSWTCNTNYYRNNSKTGCLRVPENSTSSFYSNDFKCNAGYDKSGSRCNREAAVIKIPNNSHKVGTSWTCNAYYYRNNSKTSCLRVPTNSSSSNNINYFICNTGYDKSGNRCVKKTTNNNNSCLGSYSASWTNCSGAYTSKDGNKYIGFFKNGDFDGQGTYTWPDGSKYVGEWKDDTFSGQGTYTWPSGQKYVGGWKNGKYHGQATLTLSDGKIEQRIYENGEQQDPIVSIPQNSHKTGSSWTCNANYYRNSSKKACLKVPENSYSAFNSNEFKCNKGYRKIGNKCEENIIIPQNSHKVGSGWICDYDYYHNSSKTACIRVPVNSSSSSASNDFKCNTGYSKSGNKCVEDIIIPQNSHKTGIGWICNANFYRNSSKTACLRVPANSTSSRSSNDFKCNSDFNKNGDTCKKDYKTEIVITAIIIFLIWLFNRKSKLKTPSDPKPKPKSTPTPKPKSTPIPAPQTKPKPKPRSSWRRIKDPRTLVIEIAVAVAMSDGNLADIEGITINKWMKKKLDQDINNEKIKKLFNDTLKEAHLLAESGQLNLREICSKLNSKGTKELQLEALDLAYEVMGADGHIHEQEAEMIHSLASFLKISSTEIEEIRDQFMIKTSIMKDFNILNLLGLPISASKQSKCNELKKEYRKWNGRLNSLSSPIEKKNAQKVLDLLGIARKLIDC